MWNKSILASSVRKHSSSNPAPALLLSLERCVQRRWAQWREERREMRKILSQCIITFAWKHTPLLPIVSWNSKCQASWSSAHQLRVSLRCTVVTPPPAVKVEEGQTPLIIYLCPITTWTPNSIKCLFLPPSLQRMMDWNKMWCLEDSNQAYRSLPAMFILENLIFLVVWKWI